MSGQYDVADVVVAVSQRRRALSDICACGGRACCRLTQLPFQATFSCGVAVAVAVNAFRVGGVSMQFIHVASFSLIGEVKWKWRFRGRGEEMKAQTHRMATSHTADGRTAPDILHGRAQPNSKSQFRPAERTAPVVFGSDWQLLLRCRPQGCEIRPAQGHAPRSIPHLRLQ